jgi:hypothetical protein
MKTIVSALVGYPCLRAWPLPRRKLTLTTPSLALLPGGTNSSPNNTSCIERKSRRGPPKSRGASFIFALRTDGLSEDRPFFICGSHAPIGRGASLPKVQTTLAHGNIATMSGYCTPGPTARADCAWIRGCFSDEEQD